MAEVFGVRLYGQVERVPGEAYVSTAFFHFNYIPLIPLRTFRIIDGTDHDGDIYGTRIPMRGKSVAVGYLRGWLGATAVVSSLFIVANILTFFGGRRGSPLNALIAIGSIGVLAASVWYILTTKSNRYVSALALLIGLAYTWWSVVVAERIGLPGAEKDSLVQYLPAFPITLGALVGYSLTRVFTHARLQHSIDEEFRSSVN